MFEDRKTGRRLRVRRSVTLLRPGKPKLTLSQALSQRDSQKDWLPLEINYLPHLPSLSYTQSHCLIESHSQTLKSQQTKRPTYSILEGKSQSCTTTESAFPRKPIIPRHSKVTYFQKMCIHVCFSFKWWMSFQKTCFLHKNNLVDTHALNTLSLVLSDVMWWSLVSTRYIHKCHLFMVNKVSLL